MKTQDLAFSVMLHAGLLAGVVCGVHFFGDDPEEDVQVEPFFFEVLEESVIAGSSVPSAGDESGEIRELPVPPEPKPEKSVSENAVQENPVSENAVQDGILPAMEVAEDEVADALPDPYPESAPDPEPERETPLDPEPEQTAGDDGVPVPVQTPESGEPSETPDLENAKVLSAPEAMGRIVPRYPRSARRRGREGAVTVDVSVSDSGEVTGAEVLVSSGHEDLDSAAVSAVRSARFVPATENGNRVSGNVRLTFEFRLK